MTVIQADGQNVQPVETDQFRIAPGETVDILVRPEEWSRAVDTALSSPDDFADDDDQPALMSLDYQVKARSIVVLSRSANVA